MKRKREIAIIVLAALCYVVGTIGVLEKDAVVAIVFFCAESVLCVLLAYMFATNTNEIKDNEGIDEELLLNMEQETTELKQRIIALEREVDDRTKEIENLKLQNDENESSLKTRIEELEDNKSMENAEAFLPPIDESETDDAPVNVIEIARETAEELESFAKAAGITVELSTTVDELLVKGNATRIKIMFKNIIDNSIKYMNREGKLIITISSIGEDIFVVLKDNGNGLSEEETKHVFELNFQGSNRISGNGLGLTQAKAIVDYYGGTIYAKSNQQKGMGIYIQLPAN